MTNSKEIIEMIIDSKIKNLGILFSEEERKFIIEQNSSEVLYKYVDDKLMEKHNDNRRNYELRIS